MTFKRKVFLSIVNFLQFLFQRKKLQKSLYFNCNLDIPLPENHIDIISVAFNNTQVIEYQIRLVKKNIVDENYSHILSQSLTQVITSITQIVGTIVMMLTISWQITLIALATVPLSTIVAIVVMKKSQKYFVAQQRILGEINSHVEEMYSAHNVVKAFGYEKRAL